jgi:DNA-binding CsgD family transcriptional regulator
MAAVADLDRGRDSFARQAWADAYESLSAADRADALRAEDLESLATSAYMLGREDEYFRALERAHQAHLDAGEPLPGARCATWVGMQLAVGGEIGGASGWFARAQRLVEREGRDCVERGYLLIPLAFQHEAKGDWEAAAASVARAAEIGERFGDRDLFALAVHEQGHVLILHGRIEEGLGLLDEAMVAVRGNELSPIVTGIVYCGVILACQEAYELRRAQEWTAALTGWCERQPDLVAFTGRCRVHRAEIMHLQGAWSQALDEARRAAERSLRGKNPRAAGEAAYLEGEVLRLRGELAVAEASFRQASAWGREPQPGLALLRLAEGRPDVAAAAIRRSVDETTEPVRQARLLPAQIEIMLALGDRREAHRACARLEEIAAGHAHGMLAATAAQVRGAVALAEGEARTALVALRDAAGAWQELGAPYELARVRELIGLACRALGDEDTAALELGVARDGFARLDAALDLARLDSLLGAAPAQAHGLTERELEVLRHLAAGETNKTIAAELVLSVRTVDRHVSNIFAKLGVSSRAAATTFAHEHRLV